MPDLDQGRRPTADNGQRRSTVYVVAAVIDQGALTFDLAIPCEVFGLDRSDIAAPWYELMVGGRRFAGRRA